MRRLAIASTLFVVSLAAHEGLADPDTLRAGDPATPIPQVHVSNFKLTIPLPPAPTSPQVKQVLAPYSGGPFDVSVDIVDDTNTFFNDATVHLTTLDGLDQTQTAPAPVNAQGPKSFTFHDPKGLTSACWPKPYRIDLKSLAGAQTASGQATATCTIVSTKVEDPWNHAEPDRVFEAQKASVFLTNATLEKATCADGIKLKVTVVNHSKISAASLIVQGKDAATGRVVTQVEAAFPLAAGASKTVELAPPQRYADVPDRVDIAIVDWTKQLGANVQNQGLRVVTSKSCIAVLGSIPKPEMRAMAPAK